MMYVGFVCDPGIDGQEVQGNGKGRDNRVCSTGHPPHCCSCHLVSHDAALPGQGDGAQGGLGGNRDDGQVLWWCFVGRAHATTGALLRLHTCRPPGGVAEHQVWCRHAYHMCESWVACACLAPSTRPSHLLSFAASVPSLHIATPPATEP